MARPASKSQLITQAQANFEALMQTLDALPPADRVCPGVNGPWAVRDVLAHLSAWHHLFFEWYEAGSRGEKAPMPAPGYTWKTTPELNERIFQEHRHEDYETTLARLEDSHHRIMAIIESHSDEELFTKRRYMWTGSTSLGSYAVSATSSHYEWAIDLIRSFLRSRIRA